MGFWRFVGLEGCHGVLAFWGLRFGGLFGFRVLRVQDSL